MMVRLRARILAGLETTAVPTAWLRDSELSFTARGLLVLIVAADGGVSEEYLRRMAGPDEGEGTVPDIGPGLSELSRKGLVSKVDGYWYALMPEEGR